MHIKLIEMETMKYTIIKSATQYNEYCKMLEQLLAGNDQSTGAWDEIDLLTLLIERWDAENNTFDDVDPVELIHSLMHDHKLKAKDLTEILGVSKGLVSDILNYKKGLSKDIIRLLSAYFKVSQEAFNRPYRLKNPVNSHLRDASVMNTPKGIELAF
jgi:HTH-type transcriptional regulator/antitoxin HigA